MKRALFGTTAAALAGLALAAQFLDERGEKMAGPVTAVYK